MNLQIRREKNQNKDNYKKYTTQMTASEIKECRKSLKGIIIAPYQDKKAKGIGYNLSPSELVYSLRKGAPLQIFHNNEGSYVWLAPHDTVLTLSYEYLNVDDDVTGTFHARVRNVAQGMGNISTTLDAGWKGMLLLSINNPTKKRIQLQLTRKLDGISCPCDLTTLVLWKSPQNGVSAKESTSFGLDNPPMRTDIWEDIIAQPHRFRKNSSYHRFQKFIHELITFRPEENNQIQQLRKIEKLLLQLEIAIHVDDYPFRKANSILFTLIQELQIDDNNKKDERYELWRKFLDLKNNVEKLTRNHSSKIVAEFDSAMELMRRECKYQILCQEVIQIHDFIHKNIEHWWEGGKFKRWLAEYITPNAPAGLASIILGVFLGLGNSLDTSSFWSQLIISLLPVICSFIINSRRNDK